MNLNFEKQLRKAKIKNVIRIVLIAVITVIICLPVMYFISNKIVAKSSEKLNEALMIHNDIAEPNVQIDSMVLSNSSATGGEVTANRSKNISGYVVPWDTLTSTYSLFRFQIDFNEMIPGQYQSDKNNYSYNKQTKQKVAEFYHPNIDYSSYLKDMPNDLNKMDGSKQQVSEMALSFDKPMKWSEVKEKMPKDIDVKWVYLLSNDEEKKPEGTSGLPVFGFNLYQGLDQHSFESFQKSLSSYDRSKKEDFIQDFLKKTEDKNLSDVSVLGVLVTGENKDLKQLENFPNLRASSVGVSVEKNEYIEVE